MTYPLTPAQALPSTATFWDTRQDFASAHNGAQLPPTNDQRPFKRWIDAAVQSGKSYTYSYIAKDGSIQQNSIDAASALTELNFSGLPTWQNYWAWLAARGAAASTVTINAPPASPQTGSIDTQPDKTFLFGDTEAKALFTPIAAQLKGYTLRTLIPGFDTPAGYQYNYVDHDPITGELKRVWLIQSATPPPNAPVGSPDQLKGRTNTGLAWWALGYAVWQYKGGGIGMPGTWSENWDEGPQLHIVLPDDGSQNTLGEVPIPFRGLLPGESINAGLGTGPEIMFSPAQISNADLYAALQKIGAALGLQL